MPGNSYEDFARNSFKIMLIMIIQNNLNFENPKKVKLSDLIMFYLSNIKKKDKKKNRKVKIIIQLIIA